MADDYPASQGEDELESREPTSEDLVALARSLNAVDARYIVTNHASTRLMLAQGRPFTFHLSPSSRA